MEPSEWVTNLVDSAMAIHPQHEVLSGEEMRSKIDKVNEDWHEEGVEYSEEEITVSSLNTEALYPSLDAKKCIKLCGDLIEESGLQIYGVDYTWASTYIAMACEQHEVN